VLLGRPNLQTNERKVMQAEARTNYNVTLTDREFRLVTMGLAAMLIDPEDKADALTLNTHLCHQRLSFLNQARDEASKALAGASKLENPNVPQRTR
jgi:hypothetical protein